MGFGRAFKKVKKATHSIGKISRTAGTVLDKVQHADQQYSNIYKKYLSSGSTSGAVIHGVLKDIPVVGRPLEQGLSASGKGSEALAKGLAKAQKANNVITKATYQPGAKQSVHRTLPGSVSMMSV